MAAHQVPPSLGFSRQEHWSGLPFPSPMQESEKWKWSRSVVSDSSRPHGLQPTRLLRPWDFPGKSTGVGCHCLLHIYIYTHIYVYVYVYIYIYISPPSWASLQPLLFANILKIEHWCCSTSCISAARTLIELNYYFEYSVLYILLFSTLPLVSGASIRIKLEAVLMLLEDLGGWKLVIFHGMSASFQGGGTYSMLLGPSSFILFRFETRDVS